MWSLAACSFEAAFFRVTSFGENLFISITFSAIIGCKYYIIGIKVYDNNLMIGALYDGKETDGIHTA